MTYNVNEELKKYYECLDTMIKLIRTCNELQQQLDSICSKEKLIKKIVRDNEEVCVKFEHHTKAFYDFIDSFVRPTEPMTMNFDKME